MTTDVSITDPDYWKKSPSADVAEEILMERLRQVQLENYTYERDDKYTDGQLARAAAWFALMNFEGFKNIAPAIWPPGWGEHVKIKNRTHRQNLVIAAALIVAEIERIDRLNPDEND